MMSEYPWTEVNRHDLADWLNELETLRARVAELEGHCIGYGHVAETEADHSLMVEKRIAELEAALMQIAACRCETYTAGDCTSHGGHYIDAIYTADRICDTCIANAALAGQLGKLPRMFPLPPPPTTGT